MGEDASSRSRFSRARRRADCPDREPDLTYEDVHGYIVRRWNAEGVEMLEHRWVLDPGPGLHVHHIDHDTRNNDPSNLEALTPMEHMERHRNNRDDRIRELHAQGLSQTEIGRRIGMHSSQVSRRAARLGLDFAHSKRWRYVNVNATPVLAMHDAGERVPPICRALGLTDAVVRRVLRENSRRPHRSGRPPARNEQQFE